MTVGAGAQKAAYARSQPAAALLTSWRPHQLLLGEDKISTGERIISQ